MFPAIKDAQMGVKKNNLVYLCDKQSKFLNVGTSFLTMPTTKKTRYKRTCSKFREGSYMKSSDFL